MQGRPTGGIAASAFKNTILNIDTSRPITANSEDYAGDTLTRLTDIEAFSYNYDEYDSAHRKYPWKPIMGGESASCVSDRAYYGPTNASTGHINADDISCVVSAWQNVATRPWVVGNFAWTGTDCELGWLRRVQPHETATLDLLLATLPSPPLCRQGRAVAAELAGHQQSLWCCRHRRL